MPTFPSVYKTDEQPQRRVTIVGNSGIDPDIWVAEIEGSDHPAWVIKHSGSVIHPSIGRAKVRLVLCDES